MSAGPAPGQLSDHAGPSSAIESAEPGLQADQHLVDRGWLRIGAGLAVAAQAMVFSLAINVSGIEGWAYVVVHGILIFAALATLALLGGELLASAWGALRERRISIDLLFLVTLAGALAGSLISSFTTTGAVYYEVVAILIVVHTAGKMLGARSRLAALRAAGGTREGFDRCCVIRQDGRRETCAARDVIAGDIVHVPAGGPICVDGEIVSGGGYVRETSMTGEWAPASKTVGDTVWAGTYSVDDDMTIRAAGGARKLDALLAEVERAKLAPSALQEQSDRLMRWFLPLVVGACLATFAGWLLVAPWERALFNAMAVLLVACPCAMGLATPLAIWSGLARLAQMGVVARTGDFIERMARLDVLCLDKTGTLSLEESSVVRWSLFGEYKTRETWVRQAVHVVEEGLEHPIARVLSREREQPPEGGGGLEFQLCERKIVPGAGVVATLREAAGMRHEVRIGEKRLGAEDIAETGTEGARGAQGAKRVYVFVDAVLAAEIALAEDWRDGLREALLELEKLGVDTEILSGDPHAEVALAVPVANTGARVLGALGPLEKSERVAELRRSRRVVGFAGDGLNDAAALTVADASIAMKSGANLARASAMAVMVGDDLRVLPQAVKMSREVLRNIRINLRFAAAYNLAGCALAAAGVLHPVVAAFLMLGSSLFVSVRALRGA